MITLIERVPEGQASNALIQWKYISFSHVAVFKVRIGRFRFYFEYEKKRS